MIATVQIACDGAVVACLDSDDYPAEDEDRALMGLRADDLLDQCSRVAIATWLDLRSRVEDDGDGE